MTGRILGLLHGKAGQSQLSGRSGTFPLLSCLYPNWLRIDSMKNYRHSIILSAAIVGILISLSVIGRTSANSIGSALAYATPTPAVKPTPKPTSTPAPSMSPTPMSAPAHIQTLDELQD